MALNIETKVGSQDKLPLVTPEKLTSSEVARDVTVRQNSDTVAEDPAAVLSQPVTPLPQGDTKPHALKEIESVLEEDMEDLYMSLSAADKLIFKVKGEEAAGLISRLLTETKIRIKAIYDVIVGWLKVVPGINRAYIEQEAKIKTDRLLKINKNE